jgi:hypothetical protein
MTLRSVHELFEADHDGAVGHTHVVLANGTRVARLAVDGARRGRCTGTP